MRAKEGRRATQYKMLHIGLGAAVASALFSSCPSGRERTDREGRYAAEWEKKGKELRRDELYYC